MFHVEKTGNAYPGHYHHAVNCLVGGQTNSARAALAKSLRSYRTAGEYGNARAMLAKAAWIGYPVKLRPNGRYR